LGLFSRGMLDRIGKLRREWQQGELKQALSKSQETQRQFRTLSGIEVGGLYTPQDVSEQNFEENIGFPGAYPFTRGGLPDYVPGEAVDTTPDRRAGHGKLYQR
jgi:methylmalonyl-CoA mutase N-terminal domain/subunit